MEILSTLVGHLAHPISGGPIKNPVIFEGCMHTLDQKDIEAQVRSDLIQRIGIWHLALPEKVACPLCKKEQPFNAIVQNSEWKRVSNLVSDLLGDDILESVSLSQLSQMELRKEEGRIKLNWQMKHLKESFNSLTVSNLLQEFDDPVVKKLLEEGKFNDDIRVIDLFEWKLKRVERSEMDLTDLRPDFLKGGSDGSSRKEVFVSKPWTFFGRLHFIASAIYHFTLALISEVALGFFYFWGYALLTKKRYTQLRENHVINRIVPLYLKDLGIDSGK